MAGVEQLAVSLNQLFGWSIAASVIITCLLGILWSIWLNRIKEGQKAEFQKQIESQKAEFLKEIENLKSKNENKTYITKTQFDAEFKMYQELSEVTFQAILKSYLLFPTGLDSISSDKEEAKKEYRKRYDEAVKTLFDLQNLLFKYAAFIEENLYKKFDDIRLLIQLNVNYFPEIRLRDDIHSPDDIQTECFKRTKGIEDKHNMLISNLRTYLKSLKVQED